MTTERTTQLYSPECGKGWDGLLKLYWTIMRERFPLVDTLQIKEKFGTLRIYISLHPGVNDPTAYWNEANRVVDAIEQLSRFICEDCGTSKDVHTKNISTQRPWILTLCDTCREKRAATP